MLVEGVFYGIVTADVVLFLLLCCLCVVGAQWRTETVQSAVVIINADEEGPVPVASLVAVV